MPVNPDLPDPADRTMHRLELTEAMDAWFPQWRAMIGEAQRDGWHVGWLDPATPVAGALLADFGEDRQPIDATALPWQDLGHKPGQYYLLRPPEARETWVRALPRWPATYTVEALVLVTPADPDNGVHRWRVLTADEQPVMLADADGTNPRPLLLRENCVYDISHDIEGGWEVWARDEQAATSATAPSPDS